ncbi:phosphopantetheine-binding protein [Marinicrinis sediminis]|uniref:Phosphopantetheine-binding protein n=1 Tax=Marinicrinis sediminis TaxID=1652465 RepID=A0ABW5REH2_9BACL
MSRVFRSHSLSLDEIDMDVPLVSDELNISSIVWMRILLELEHCFDMDIDIEQLGEHELPTLQHFIDMIESALVRQGIPQTSHDGEEGEDLA